MTISAFPPGMALIMGALLLPLVGPRIRATLMLGLPLATLWLVWGLPEGVSSPISLLGYELTLVRGDALGRLFAIIFSLMAFAGMLFALRQKSTLELMAAMIYAGGAVGVALAGDLITLFVFWESMALASSTVLLSAGGQTTKVAMRYFQVHMAGGALLMSGILAHVLAHGSIAFDTLDAGTLGGALILAGVLLNAAAPPLSAWLPDAYPEASYSGTVFLSAFTTKAAVCVLIRGFPGTEILIWVGLFMIFYGIIYALLENDMRRILAYSIVNQVGFMVVGVGIGTEMALNGAAAHAFAHIIYKGLLLMSAGAVLYQTGKRKCTDLGGLFQSMPLTMICGVIGALAISSFPWTSGFVSKSMISQAAGDEHLVVIWFGLMAASAGVFLHAGIKFPWFVFFQKDSGLRPPDPPWNMRMAMVLFAALCIGLGILPEPLYMLLPYPVAYVPYTASHVLEMLQLLMFSGLAFFLMLPLMRRTLTITLDVDWFYRRLGGRLVRPFAEMVGRIDVRGRRVVLDGYSEMAGLARNGFGEHGKLGGAQTASSMVTVLLFTFGVILLWNLLKML
uniref:Multisubunit sodium/proton antiporter, MrpD subunit n=1 Tax=Candidatus Kentrum eta TaxID=2126337 RepID=A0A450UBU5_9GAMM|nr:MAG: multisubunit sodium/proton antiporter, MrpD subunit [Candidatus Kentron sp. H]VFJ92743.1 MAG: multisubunit sodium/proton antiporter, MrpD subunit [Candidatus Kentron sp. H]VFJ97610.1 MAG: multisubunit sodium/proton antiporter, MrpD subunit [Candidatus Kentron sp. H]